MNVSLVQERLSLSFGSASIVHYIEVTRACLRVLHGKNEISTKPRKVHTHVGGPDTRHSSNMCSSTFEMTIARWIIRYGRRLNTKKYQNFEGQGTLDGGAIVKNRIYEMVFP